MPRRLAIVLAVGALAAGCGGGGPSRSERAARARADQVRAAAGQAGLPAPVQDFMADAVGAAGRSYTVTYDVGGRAATVAQQPPSHRLDVVSPAGDAQAYIANRQGTFSCQRTIGGSWTCQPDSQPPPATGALSLDDMANAVSSLTQSAAAYDMRVEERRLVGLHARCLVATPKAAGPSAQPETLCISPEGVPLLVESSGNQVRATRYRSSASGRQFTLPAPARSG